MYHFEPALYSKNAVSLNSKGNVVIFRCFALNGSIADHPQVWSNISHDRTWSATPFVQSDIDPLLSTATFDLGFLAGPADFEFTFRVSTAAGVTWLGDDRANGTLHVQDVDVSVPTQLVALSPQGASTPSSTSTRRDHDMAIDILSWNLDSSSDITSFSLGKPPGSQILSLQRSRPTWLEAHVYDHVSHLDPSVDIQMLLIKKGSSVTAYLPLAATDCMATLRGSLDPTSSNLWLRTEKQASQSDIKAYCVVGQAPEWQLETLLHDMAVAARTVLSASSVDKDNSSNKEEHQGLTYCTWNSLGANYTLSNVFEALSGLAGKGDHVQHAFDAVLLDDGWQDVSSRLLQSYGAKSGFIDVSFTEQEDVSIPKPPDSGYASPTHNLARHDHLGSADLSFLVVDDLAKGISLLKARYPFIRRVGTWMTLQGYWNGIAPESKLGKRFDVKQLVNLSTGETVWSPYIEGLRQFYVEYFAALKAAGVDFVKLDNQAAMDHLAVPVGSQLEEAKVCELREKAYLVALEAADETFGVAKATLCMAHSPRVIASSIGLGAVQRTWRQWDDYLPDADDSHRFMHSHISYLTLLSRVTIGLEPDFDMFQTCHDFAEYHASLRALSTAPLLVTDKPGVVADVPLHRLTGLSKTSASGRSTIQGVVTPVRLSCTVFGEQDVVDGPGPPCNLVARVPGISACVVGMWNCRGAQAVATAVLTKRHVADALLPLALSLDSSATDFLLYSPWSSSSSSSSKAATVKHLDVLKEASKTPLQSEPVWSSQLLYKGWDLVSIVPWLSLSTAVGIQFACLGLTDKYAGLTAIRQLKTGTFASASASAPKPVEKVVTARRSIWACLWDWFADLGRRLYDFFSFAWLGRSAVDHVDSERTPLLGGEDSAATADPETEQPCLDVVLSHAGLLSFAVTPALALSSSSFRIVLDGCPVPLEAMTCTSLGHDSQQCVLVSIDMESAIKAHVGSRQSSDSSHAYSVQFGLATGDYKDTL